MNLLGIDVGTTSLKACLFDESGKRLGDVTLDYALDTRGDLVEFDANQYVAIAKDAVSQIRKIAPIDAIAIDTQGETMILTDEAGTPLMPAIVWLDNRAVAEAEEIAARFSQKEVYETTGQAETVAAWPASKLLWVKKNRPDVWQKTRRVFLLEDWLIWSLTGEFVTEPTLQSSSLYLDIRTKTWWKEMLDFIGLDEKCLPKILPCGARCGAFDSIPVVTGALDQISGAIGVGVIDHDITSVMTGTTMAISVVEDAIPPFDKDSKVPCHLHALDGKYVRLLWSTTAGMALKWFRTGFAPELTFHELDGLAEKAGVGAAGLVMLPYLTGSTMPVYNPAARGTFWGLTMEHGVGHFARAIMEAVAFTLKDNLDYIDQKAGEIRITGGGASSPLWAQIQCDVTGSKLVTLSEKESACLGTAILAGVGLGVFNDIEDACKKLVSPKRVYTPSGDDYTAAYARYRKLNGLLNNPNDVID